MEQDTNNRFDELLNEKFRNFEEIPPESILQNIKTSLNQNNGVPQIKKSFFNKFFITGLIVAVSSALSVIIFANFNNNTAETKSQEAKQEFLKKENITVTPDNDKKAIAESNETDVSKKDEEFVNICGLSGSISKKTDETIHAMSTGLAIKTDVSKAELKATKPGKYKLEIKNKNNESKIVYVNFKPKFKGINTDTTICGNECVLTARSGNAGTWEKTNNTIVSSVNNKDITIKANEGNYTFVWNADNQTCSVDSFRAVFAQFPVSEFTYSGSLCENNEVKLNYSGLKEEKVQWSTSSGTILNAENKTASFKSSQSGSIAITLQVTSKEKCKSKTTKNIELYEVPKFNLTTENAGCGKSGSATISQANNNGNKYFWDNENHAGAISKSYLNPGKYSVKAVNKNNCSTIKTFEIENTGNLKASFYYRNISDNTILFVNTSKEGNSSATGNNKLKYLWDFGDGTTSSEESPQHQYAKSSLYNVTLKIYSDLNDCSDQFRINDIKVSFNSENIANVFSPNGDGKNDVFTISGINISNFHAIITNTKGEKIYEWDNPEAGWNGYIKGSPAASGTYFYTISGTRSDGSPYQNSGHVKLVRE